MATEIVREGIYNPETGLVTVTTVEREIVDPGPIFLPMDPAPFWLAALDLLNITQEGILAGIPEGIEREAARINMRDRKTYVRHDPMVEDLATRQNIPSEQMDSLWLYAQENYK